MNHTNASMKFTKAAKKRSKLRLGLTGPSGSGKTYSALMIAAGMGGRIAVIDTERGSASLYAGLAEFDALELEPPYTPERFIEAIHIAESNGYDILIIDSISHEWNGSGGCLEINDRLAATKYNRNTWSAWSETTPRHRKFLDALIQSPMHIIATMRSKTETAQSTDNGKVKVTKLGMKSEQREGAEYEFTVVLDLTHEGNFATQSKDRTGLFANRDPFVINTGTGKTLMDWLNSGADEMPVLSAVEGSAPAPAPQQASQKKESVISEQQHRALEAEIRTKGLDRERVVNWVQRNWGVPKLSELPEQYLNQLTMCLGNWSSKNQTQAKAA
jgi:hypothetical protein